MIAHACPKFKMLIDSGTIETMYDKSLDIVEFRLLPISSDSVKIEFCPFCAKRLISHELGGLNFRG